MTETKVSYANAVGTMATTAPSSTSLSIEEKLDMCGARLDSFGDAMTKVEIGMAELQVGVKAIHENLMCIHGFLGGTLNGPTGLIENVANIRNLQGVLMSQVESLKQEQQTSQTMLTRINETHTSSNGKAKSDFQTPKLGPSLF